MPAPLLVRPLVLGETAPPTAALIVNVLPLLGVQTIISRAVPVALAALMNLLPPVVPIVAVPFVPLTKMPPLSSVTLLKPLMTSDVTRAVEGQRVHRARRIDRRGRAGV